jgi:hypothetical protein
MNPSSLEHRPPERREQDMTDRPARYHAELLWTHLMGSTWVIRDREADDYVMGGPQNDLRSLKFMSWDEASAEAERMNLGISQYI